MRKLNILLAIFALVTINLLIANSVKKEAQVELGGKTIATSTIDAYIDSLVADQSNWLLSHPKYFSIDWTYLPQFELTYKIDEYEKSDGSIGYQIYIKRDNGAYKSFGVGDEASIYSYDWRTSASSTHQ